MNNFVVTQKTLKHLNNQLIILKEFKAKKCIHLQLKTTLISQCLSENHHLEILCHCTMKRSERQTLMHNQLNSYSIGEKHQVFCSFNTFYTVKTSNTKYMHKYNLVLSLYHIASIKIVYFI